MLIGDLHRVTIPVQTDSLTFGDTQIARIFNDSETIRYNTSGTTINSKHELMCGVKWCVIRGLVFSLSNPIQSTVNRVPQYIYNRIPLNTTSYEKMTWYATKLLGKTSSWTHSWAMLLLLPIQVNVVEEANKRYKLCWWTTLSSAPRRQVNQPAYCDDKQTINRYAVHMCVRLLLLASWGKSSTTPKYIFVSGGGGEYFG